MDADTGRSVAQAFSPAVELEIASPQPGWAEQHPDTWWEHVRLAVAKVLAISNVRAQAVAALGISYQMHGLVLLDRKQRVLRPAIIWCDSRAVPIGEQALRELGSDYCLSHYLNSPGNFTASKLSWVKQHQPEIFSKAHKAMLPGDYIAFRLTGEITTTVSGLSEGIFWDYAAADVAERLLNLYGIDGGLLPDRVATFSNQGALRAEAAALLGLPSGIPVSYRAGDQPNNAFSLNVLEPGEVAATAGTSGVIYAVTDQAAYDPQSRVNTFVHVNNSVSAHRNGVLLCINGTGILNSWTKRLLADMSYDQMNALAATVPIGAEGVTVLPFGNGAERVLGNRNVGAQINHLDLNRHHRAHVARAVQEGIVFALAYGFEVLHSMGIRPAIIRAGHTNMFLSPVFREAFVNTLQVPLELFETDGASGAARGAGVGAGIFSFKEAFRNLRLLHGEEPNRENTRSYQGAYANWKKQLQNRLAQAD